MIGTEKTKGIVVKVKGTHCIVLAKDGTYHRVPVFGNKNVRVGAETEFFPVNRLRFIKPMLMVASLLILACGLSLYFTIRTPETFAYVSLDINPSVEIEADKDLKVLSIYPLNSDGVKLLGNVKMDDNIDLSTCINLIMTESVKEGYLKPGQKNYVLSAITLKSESPQAINYDSFSQNLNTAVENKDLDVEIVILSTDLQMRNQAKKQGLSAGKLAIYSDTLTSGGKLTLEQVKENSLIQLVNVYKVHLLPNNKQLVIKSIHIPPHTSKKYDSSVDKKLPDGSIDKKLSAGSIDKEAPAGDSQAGHNQTKEAKKHDVDKEKSQTNQDINQKTNHQDTGKNNGEKQEKQPKDKEERKQEHNGLDSDKKESQQGQVPPAPSDGEEQKNAKNDNNSTVPDKDKGGNGSNNGGGQDKGSNGSNNGGGQDKGSNGSNNGGGQDKGGNGSNNSGGQDKGGNGNHGNNSGHDGGSKKD